MSECAKTKPMFLKITNHICFYFHASRTPSASPPAKRCNCSLYWTVSRAASIGHESGAVVFYTLSGKSLPLPPACPIAVGCFGAFRDDSPLPHLCCGPSRFRDRGSCWVCGGVRVCGRHVPRWTGVASVFHAFLLGFVSLVTLPRCFHVNNLASFFVLILFFLSLVLIPHYIYKYRQVFPLVCEKRRDCQMSVENQERQKYI